MSDTRGLTTAEARARLERFGPNEIRRERRTPGVRLLARQFASPLVLLLLGAGVLSAAVGELVDAVAIGAIVVLNGLVGFYQEHTAEAAVHALRRMTAPRARVVRDGEAHLVPAAEVVPGDVLLLEAGDVIAADANLVEAHALETNEAPLTGESLPVGKRAEAVAAGAPLAERADTVFLGTAVTRGSGAAEVVATGMATELGRIAHLLDTAADVATPLQVELARVGRTLLALCGAIVALMVGVGLLQGRDALEVVMTGVSLAVAAVPEGLPALVTIALAVGVRRMASRHVLVRRLPSVETLGSTTVICTDKTGTLTAGRMAVREVWGPDPAAVIRAAVACSDAEVHPDGTATGDPTEIALVRAGLEQGIDRAALEAGAPRVAVHPFDTERKRMSVLRADGRLYVKGAPDLLVPLCVRGADGALAENERLAAAGLRVLAVAVGRGPDERDLELLGLVGLADPPRPDATEAIAQARRAGVRTVMITGDHPVTAAAIAREMGIVGPGEAVEGRVHARVTPEDKLRIVRAFREQGEIVAMTGDGVNDAPALREAHVGIAMGRAGTEVTREAADVVLADDRYASIVAAVREGRGIWDNLRKTLLYLLSANFGELAIVLLAAAAGLPLPLLPLHLLWVNLVTDGLPALALVVDPPAPDVLERPPRDPREVMLGRRQWASIALTGLLQASVVLGVYVWSLQAGDVERARTVAFSTLVFVELARVFGARDPRRTFFEVGAFTNLRLLLVLLVSGVVQLAILAVPQAQALLGLSALPVGEIALALGLGLVPVTVIEVGKLLRRALSRN